VLAVLTVAALLLLAGPTTASAKSSKPGTPTVYGSARLTFSPGSSTVPVVGGQDAVATITLPAPAGRGGVPFEIRKYSVTSPIGLPTFGCFSPCTPARNGLIVVVPEGRTTTTVAIRTFATTTLTQDSIGARSTGSIVYIASAGLWVTP
jgi:hypothetical protein